MPEVKINLKEIIKECYIKKIEYKLLKGFGIDVDYDSEFVFINKNKGIPLSKLKLLNITSDKYDINTTFDPYYEGYWLTKIELKSRKYKWNLDSNTKTYNKNIKNKPTYTELLEKSNQYKLRMSERVNWRGYLNYIDYYDGRMQ